MLSREQLRSNRRLSGALNAITAAVVGVVLNLTVWFVLHVLFATVDESHAGPVRLFQPVWTSFDWRAGILAAISCWLVFRAKWSVMRVLGLAAVGGLALSLA